jgi:signal transduction histidine kinase
MDKNQIENLMHDCGNRLLILSFQLERLEKLIFKQCHEENVQLQYNNVKVSFNALNMIFSIIEQADRDMLYDVNELVREIMKSLEVDQFNLHLREKDKLQAPHLSKVVLQRIIDNLVINSIHFGAKNLIIEIDKDRVRICDDAGGMEQSVLEKLQSGVQVSQRICGGGRGFAQIISFCDKVGWTYELENSENECGFGMRFDLIVR